MEIILTLAAAHIITAKANVLTVLYLAAASPGFFWYECKEVWIEGLRSYFLDWWNCLDVMVLSMYLASFALRVLIMLKGHFLCMDLSSSADCVYFTQTGMGNRSHSA